MAATNPQGTSESRTVNGAGEANDTSPELSPRSTGVLASPASLTNMTFDPEKNDDRPGKVKRGSSTLEDLVNAQSSRSNADGKALKGAMERQIFGGIQYHLDDSHWMCTFVYDRNGTERKLLRYDLNKLIGVGGILSMFCSGTIFTMDRQIFKTLAAYLVALVIVAVAVHVAHPNDSDLEAIDTDSLEELTSYINGFVPFVLALYVSLVLSRWWALRREALGNLFNAVSNTIVIVATSLHGEKWFIFREEIMRLAMASIYLVVQAARQENELTGLVDTGLVTDSEAEILKSAAPFQRSTTMWVWILRLCDVAFKSQGLPPPRYNAVVSKAQQARDGIQTIHTYLDTQMPFAYVHLITLLVNIQNISYAVKCGFIVAVEFRAGRSQQVVAQFVMCILVVMIYQGLLIISYIVHDPFGEDLLDFPVVAYMEYVSWSCAAVEIAANECPALTSPQLVSVLNTGPAASKINSPAASKNDPKAKSLPLKVDEKKSQEENKKKDSNAKKRKKAKLPFTPAITLAQAMGGSPNGRQPSPRLQQPEEVAVASELDTDNTGLHDLLKSVVSELGAIRMAVMGEGGPGTKGKQNLGGSSASHDMTGWHDDDEDSDEDDDDDEDDEEGAADETAALAFM